MGNAFAGKTKAPTDDELGTALGASRVLWDQLLATLGDKLKLTRREWSTSSPKLGWSLRIKDGDRIIVYLAPMQGCFRASFALGGKAVEAALAAGLPASAVAIIRSAKKYAEGTAVRIEVKQAQDIEIVSKLALAKRDN